jgi:hypothetical protein
MKLNNITYKNMLRIIVEFPHQFDTWNFQLNSFDATLSEMTYDYKQGYYIFIFTIKFYGKEVFYILK